MCVYVLSLCVYVCGVHSVPHSTLWRKTVKHRRFKYVKIESWNDVFAEILSSVSFSFGTADAFHLWKFFSDEQTLSGCVLCAHEEDMCIVFVVLAITQRDDVAKK